VWVLLLLFEMTASSFFLPHNDIYCTTIELLEYY
jgi:hypothetical protein